MLTGLLALSTGPASAETTTITQGSVTWGVKQSWRNYIGETGISISGGVTRAAGGAFDWPVESGSYDSETKALELQLKGSVHFTAHEGALDMTVSSPRLVIDGDDPQLFAEVVSKSESTGQLIDHGEIPMVSLDLDSGAPETTDGVTTWTPVSTALTAEGYEAFSRNYPTGTVLDPVSASYTGPGAKPVATQETWTPAGSLTYTQTGTEAIQQATSILPDKARGLVHVVTLSTVQAYDATTWEPVGTAANVGSVNFPAAILDEGAGAVVLNVNNKLTALRWNAQTRTYDSTVLIDGLQQGFAYDRFGRRILVADPGTGLRVVTFADGAWTIKVHPLAGVPVGRPQVAADAQGRIVVVAASSVPKLVTISGDTAALVDLPGDYSNPTAQQSGFQYPSEVYAPSTGGFMLTNYQGKIYRTRPSGNTFVRDETVRTTGLGAVLRTTADSSTDTWYLADNTLQTVTAVTESSTGVFKVKDLGYFVVYPIGLAASDGTVYATAGAMGGSNEDYGIRTYRLVGTSPTISTQPQSTTATVGVGETSDDVTFTAAATGTPAAALRWQQRSGTTGRFADVVGASGGTLTVTATAAAHGRQYRAVASNAAGSIASDVATLSVDAAPTVVINLADRAVEAGSDALFEVMPAGTPYPSITWQRRVSGFWQDVPAGDDDLVVDGGKLTVRSTNADQNGTLLRAKLTNRVATVYSRTATLSVERPSQVVRGIKSGELDWGVKKSFRDYAAGPIAHGTITVSGGASSNADGTFAFPVAGGTYDPSTKKTEVDFTGTVRFTGHDGALEVSVTDPEVDVTGSAGTLSAKVVSKSLDSGQSVDYGRVALADLDTSSGLGVAGDAMEIAGVPATLTGAGSPAFAGFYAAGTALDPLGAHLALGDVTGVAPDAASQTSVKPAKATFGYGTTTSMTVTVTSPAGTPTGPVHVVIAGKTLTGALQGGKAVVALPSGLTPGKHAVTATYGGGVGVAGSSGSTSVMVTKATPRVTISFAKATITKGQRAKLRIAVAIPGASARTVPHGRLTVRDGNRVLKAATLKVATKGKVVLTLPKLKKGKHRIRVSLSGTSTQVAVHSTYRVLKVRP